MIFLKKKKNFFSRSETNNIIFPWKTKIVAIFLNEFLSRDLANEI